MNMLDRLNRTKVELKHVTDVHTDVDTVRLNRTKVELKLETVAEGKAE